MDPDLSSAGDITLMIINKEHPVRRDVDAVHDRLEVPRFRLGKPKLVRVKLLIEDLLEAKRAAHVPASQVLLVGCQSAAQSKITDRTHRVQHRLSNFDPEARIDDLL